MGEPRILNYIFRDDGRVDEALTIGLLVDEMPSKACAYVRSLHVASDVFDHMEEPRHFAVQYYGIPDQAG
ncbi:MAG: hypothetical protein KKD18_06330 [Nanoarchaeota archaeon]|nr:hypothetical protein [Nanoarchaeota archaeon]MBU0978010.1 hypothetical protein [Nanoarchaeota archaeon]